MPWPVPQPGLLIRYAYLWRREFDQGQEEGIKDRPCAVILVTADTKGEQVVSVLPVTHTPPANAMDAAEIPPATKQRLGLDDERSWIVLTEANRFIWPGPDLRPLRTGELESAALGVLPKGLFEEVRRRFVEKVKARRVQLVGRSE